MRMLAIIVLMSLAAVVPTGCGSGNEDGDSTARPAVTTLPACAPKASPAELPAAFPETFPLPTGAVVREARDDGKTMTVEAVVPGDIRDVADALLEDLPQAGYELGEGDSEEHEAESHFNGNGFAGFFKLNTVGDCDGANTLAVVLTRS
jgi:hypothetical protein